MTTHCDRVFYYGCDGFNDFGWGCVYRCLQTLLGIRRHAVPSVPDIMAHLAIPLDRQNPRSMWIEPNDVRGLIPERTELVIYAPNERVATRRMTRTSMQDAEHLFASPCKWEMHFRRALSLGPIVLDDGVYSYLALKAVRGGFLIMDPHVQERHVCWRSVDWLKNSPMWMALCFSR